ncbi:MAG: L-histidine N(alpha)-methyltransferase [Flavobacteriales bacterium]|nr:L-histidine N(alpha)-methyltransferase [Flavobacteriales bacterium]
MIEQFKADVANGLSATPKSLLSKYFYDEIGDKLFVQIMHMPEYYLTDAEMEIFEHQAEKLATLLAPTTGTFDLIELGAGDGTKTVHLLKELQKHREFCYKPIDISSHALASLKDFLQSELPDLKVETQQGDYFEVLKGIADNGNPKAILFLGSNMGNMLDHNAKRFLSSLDNAMNAEDKLLLGLDLKKKREVVLPAYNDAAGITKAFNLNLLTLINNELGGNFDVDSFEHAPEYNEEEGVAKSYIRSKVDQEVRIDSLGESYYFEKGERIHMEISRKYNEEILNAILGDTSLVLQEVIKDSKNLFADFILTKQST